MPLFVATSSATAIVKVPVTVISSSTTAVVKAPVVIPSAAIVIVSATTAATTATQVSLVDAAGHVGGPDFLLALIKLGFVLDNIAFAERIAIPDAGRVAKHVFAAVGRLDEPESSGVPPAGCSLLTRPTGGGAATAATAAPVLKTSTAAAAVSETASSTAAHHVSLVNAARHVDGPDLLLALIESGLVLDNVALAQRSAVADA
jgi:hypothetical protein